MNERESGMAQQQTLGGEQEVPASPMAERLRQAKDLADATFAGVRATVESTATVASGQASSRALDLDQDAEVLAQTIGAAVVEAVRGAARSTGAVAGGLQGATSGLRMARQIGAASAGEAMRDVADSSLRAASKVTEGVLLGFEDQEKGSAMIREATRALAREVFDATTGAALGALGSLATAVGALAGGALGAREGTSEGLQQVADAGADVTWALSQEAVRSGSGALRRALRRTSDDPE